METRATTIKCVHLGCDALIDMFQYKDNAYMIFVSVKRANFKWHKNLGGIEGIKDELHSNWSFSIKWHYMAKPAMNAWHMKGTVQFRKKQIITKFSNIMN